MLINLTDPANVGGRIRHMREKRGMSQPELAKAIGIKQPSLSAIENGKTKSPTGINLLRIAAVLDASPQWIATGEGSPDSLPSPTEEEMIQAFRDLTPDKQGALLAAAKALK